MSILDIRFDVRDGLVVVQIQQEGPTTVFECGPKWSDASATDILEIAEALRKKYATCNSLPIKNPNSGFGLGQRQL